MIYKIQNEVVDYLPNVIDLITDRTIQGAIVGDDGKLSVYIFTDERGQIGELVVFHSNWRATMAHGGQVVVGDWDAPTSTMLVDANGGTCQVKGDQLIVETSSLLV
ncbi:hypothetical protein BH11CYA1_BH11CYA1_49230 [soil metagenome]